MFYFVKTPGWIKKLYPDRVWEIETAEKNIYLSFDDGPHPKITLRVLNELKQYNALATFFCIGKNVLAYPDIYKKIIDEGHTVGNHTYSHLNGWKTNDGIYLDDIALAKKYIDTKFFRPAYGKITSFQHRQLSGIKYQLKTVMWSVLSGDFDHSISPHECLENVLLNATSGSIIVFHDSTKAEERLLYALPKVLEHYAKKGYTFKRILKEKENQP